MNNEQRRPAPVPFPIHSVAARCPLCGTDHFCVTVLTVDPKDLPLSRRCETCRDELNRRPGWTPLRGRT